LFSPREVGGRQIRNRIVSTPHATGWGEGGAISRAEVDYHVRKAAGGAGLVMTFGSASVDPDSAASYGSVSLWDPQNDAALRALAEGVHAHGAVCMSQMTHMGRRGSSLLSGIPLRGASDLPEGVHREVPVVLSASELAVIVERFAESASRLRHFGWDGVEVTSFGGHLIEQFFDPAVNTRDDEYGGSLENRVRFAREILAAVRAATSEEFIIGFRVTADQHLPSGMTQQDLREVVAALTADGVVDLLSVSAGTGVTERSSSFFVPADEVPENANGELAAVMGSLTGIPVIAAGRVLDADTAEHALRDQGVDFVAMTRALIADPDLPHKLLTGGRPRPCISLNEGCIGRLYSGMPMACSINPGIRTPELDDAADVPDGNLALDASTGEHLVVVGGGVAGAEAARRAARRGHRVTLLEEQPRLGGRTRTAGLRRGRERWALYLDWLEAELRELGVDVRLGQPATADTVAALVPDRVIIATGSRSRRTAWHDSDAAVSDADDVIVAPPAPQGSASATIIDPEGGFTAPTAAEALVAAGWTVRIITDLPYVAAKVDPTQVWFVRRRLKKAGVELRGHVELNRDAAGWALLDLESDERHPVSTLDLIVLAGARTARDDLSQSFARALPQTPIHRVGDALAPRTLLDAVAEGATAGATGNTTGMAARQITSTPAFSAPGPRQLPTSR
jgi:2,4-dienoyl-CoA reductase-like NADH-dependent reductase (Old Yellow Enzyme family)/predicted NAD/FAD-dependent oxidoreductase